jgi:hypothetical protein
MLVALVATLPAAPLLAEESDEVAKANSFSTTRDELAWISGGVGDEAMQEMRKMASTYNVHVMFTERQGSYLANVPFSIVRRDGRMVYQGISDGPLLYLRLPVGAYRISAELDHVWQSRSIRAADARQPVRLSFVTKGQ